MEGEMAVYGYARVSTDGQTLDAQVSALKAAGAEKVFSEKQSGAKTDRASLARALAALASGDVLMVTKAGSPRQKHQGPSKRVGERF
jgi:DNA invertase Pin-like site-specific DNA recombinase